MPAYWQCAKMRPFGDTVCLATLEVLTGMCCQFISRSRCTMATSTDIDGVSTELHLQINTESVVCMIIRRCGYGGRVSEVWRAWYANLGFEPERRIDCPVSAAGSMSKLVRAALHHNGIPCPFFRTACTHLCHTFTRRYSISEIVVAVSSLLGVPYKRYNCTHFKVGGYDIQFVLDRATISHAVSNRVVYTCFCNGVRLLNNQLVHQLDKIASDEFFRVVGFAASVCTTICITHLRI